MRLLGLPGADWDGEITFWFRKMEDVVAVSYKKLLAKEFYHAGRCADS